MTDCRIGPEEFYRRRDDRQGELVPSLPFSRSMTGLVASPVVAQSLHGQHALLLAANLMARWSRSVDLMVPDEEVLVPGRRGGESSLRSAILKEMRRADPFGDFEFRRARSDALVLEVGPSPSAGDVEFGAWARGWEAVGWRGEGGHVSEREGGAVFLPALLVAVCIGVGQFVKRAAGQPQASAIKPFRWNMWNHRRRSPRAEAHIIGPEIPSSADLELGRVLQVGVGAVGSNLLYIMDLLGIEGCVTIVDHDHVEVENLDRSLLFGWPDALPVELPKVSAAERVLADSTLTVRPHQMTWADYTSMGLSEEGPFDLWLPLANEFDVRKAMAVSLPPLMVHGSTGSDWEFFMGRHIPLVEYCLNCRFPEDGPEPELLCARGKPAVPGEGRRSGIRADASLPFLSAGAAVLVVGELFKLSMDGYATQPNYVGANLYGPLDDIISLTHPRRRDCSTCANAPGELWRERLRGTRYARIGYGSVGG